MNAPASGTTGRRIRVLWNPTSGRKGGIPTNHASRPMLLDLLLRHGLGDELVEPGSEQEAAEAAADAVEHGYDVVVGAGGDGTIGLVARQLLGSRTALGILPLGSVMNIPRMLGVPRDLEAAAGILANGHARTIDVGHVGDHLFYEAASIGLHAAATRELPKVDRGDYGAIARSVMSAVRYLPSVVRIELDGDRTIETTALMVAVANGPLLGPGSQSPPGRCSTTACSMCGCSSTARRGSSHATSPALPQVTFPMSDAPSRNARGGYASRALDLSQFAPMPQTWARPRSSSGSGRRP